MIDLHLHTTYSDGTMSVSEILAEAAKAGVSVASITDHHTVEAYNELKTLPVESLFQGKIIPGVEINCLFGDYRIELLGYDFKDFGCIDSWLKKNLTEEKELIFRQAEYRKLLNKLDGNNIPHDCPPSYSGGTLPPLPHFQIYQALRSHEQNRKYFSEEEWSSVAMFFRSATSNKDSFFHIDYSDIMYSAAEISEVIRNAGGKVFLAHLFTYKANKPMEILEGLVSDNIIDGVEVYHSTFSLEERKTLRDFCQDKGLLMSGGSDCHGERTKKNKVGVGFWDLNITL